MASVLSDGEKTGLRGFLRTLPFDVLKGIVKTLSSGRLVVEDSEGSSLIKHLLVLQSIFLMPKIFKRNEGYSIPIIFLLDQEL